MDLSRHTKEELDVLRIGLNLTDDELIVFDMLAKRKSVLSIAEKMCVSERTVDRLIQRIRDKMTRILADNCR